MPVDATPNKLAQIPCDLYTQSTKTTGKLSTLHQRFSDALNAVELDFLLVRDITTCTLMAQDGVNASAGSALVRRQNVVLAVPRDGNLQQELKGPFFQSKRRVETIIEASPFVIRGVLHQTPSVGLLQTVHEQSRQYVPITDARVTHSGNPSLTFAAPFLMLNREYVEVMVETAMMSEGTLRATPAFDQPTPIDAEAASITELLSRTPIFEKVPADALAETCVQMLANGGLTRVAVPAGTELFRQGDIDKTICVVEAGELGVERTTPLNRIPRQIATLIAGDVAGEMALMGDGRRTSTVRALTDAVVLTVDAAAARHLMHQFPSAASSLMRLMLDREGGLDASRKSMPSEGQRLGRATAYRLSAIGSAA